MPNHPKQEMSIAEIFTNGIRSPFWEKVDKHIQDLIEQERNALIDGEDENFIEQKHKVKHFKELYERIKLYIEASAREPRPRKVNHV